jgi:MFS family permease
VSKSTLAPRTTPAGQSSRSFTVLRHRDYRLLWSAELISTIGTQMQRVAVAWQIYQLTGDAFKLGLLGLVRFAPIVIFGLFGGVLADQRDRRRLLTLTQLILCGISGILALASSRGFASLWLLYVVTFFAAAFASVAGPSRQALIPALVPREELSGAMSVNIFAMQAATVTGPAIGGWFIAQGGVQIVYAIDAISFLFVVAAVRMMHTRTAPAAAPVGTFTAAIEGFHFLWKSPVLLGVMTVDFVATFCGASMVLMPIFATEILDVGPRGLGLLLAAPAAGAVAGGFVMSVARIPHRPGAGVLSAIMLYGISVILFGLSSNFVLSLALLAFGGAADAVSMALRGAIRNLVTPDHLRGRVAATHSMFAMGGPQLGEFESGVAASFLGAGPAVALGGLGTILATALVGWYVPSIRRYRV